MDPEVPFRDAIDAFNKAIEEAEKADKKYAWGYAHRGATYRVLGCMANGTAQKEEFYTKAQKDFEDAIKLNPKYAWAYAQSGENYCCWGVDIILTVQSVLSIELSKLIQSMLGLMPTGELSTASWGGFLVTTSKAKSSPTLIEPLLTLNTQLNRILNTPGLMPI
jgi:tetratricopeptide (TPR) repeat protein